MTDVASDLGVAETWPDIEGAIRDYLREDTGVQAALGGSRRVFFAIPDAPTWPLVTVSRIGGGDDISDAPLDLALVSIDVWGVLDANGRPLKRQATAVVNSVRSALGRIRGRTTLATDVDVFGVSVAGVVWAPDPDNGRPHYSITAEVAGISS